LSGGGVGEDWSRRSHDGVGGHRFACWAVGDGGRARGDGDLISRVDSVLSIDSAGHEGGGGDDGETHVDGLDGLVERCWGL
jgi:hypothetical protein